MNDTVVPLRQRRNSAAPAHGWIHVDRLSDGFLLVQHESSGGGSFGMFARFDPDQLEDAVRYALGILADCQPARLGRVALPLGLDDPGGRAA